jgi:hypothetical protein
VSRRLVITAVAAAGVLGAVVPSFAQSSAVAGLAVHRAQTVQPLPVVVRHDDNGTAVGVGDVGIIIEKDGTICPVVSTQDWQCIPGGN